MPARPSVVCTECHRLKIGCNKAVPSCEQCTFHHRICEYQRPTLPPIDNDVLQQRVSTFEEFCEQERLKQLVPKQRDYDFDSVPPDDLETTRETIRQDALLATCPSDIFQILTKVLSLSPQRVSSIQAAHDINRPQIPIFLISDHYYYIDRDGDPCVTPALLALLPSLDKQVELLNILKVVFIFQPLGSFDDLVRRVDILRNAGPAAQETDVSSRLNHLALYAIAAGAFALASLGGTRPVLSSTQAISLYTAGRRALQLVLDHPQSPPNPVDHLWSGLLLLQFLMFSHRLTGGEQPHSGAWLHESVREEMGVAVGIVVHVCKDQEANQSLQQSVSPDVVSRDLREWAKLACTAYYYEMHISDSFNVLPLLPIDPPFSQVRFDSDALFLTTRTSLTKLIKTSFQKLRLATSKTSAVEVINSQSDAISTFLATMPASLALDVEDVGEIENVETAVQKMELVLDAWVGIVRMWRRLLAAEASLPTTVPSTPEDTLEDTSGSLSRGSPSALGESFYRRAITRATKPCIDLTTLLRAQLEILMREPRFHFYLYCQAVFRRAFDCGLIFARIITLCDEELDQSIAADALEGLRKTIDLLERAAKWFGEQRGETVVEEAETLKLLRILLAHTNNRVELLDVNSAGMKRSREAMEGMSDISAARMGDLHGLRLPFSPDTLILDQAQPCRSPSMSTQPTRAQSSFHSGSGESATKSIPSSLSPSPSSTSQSNSVNATAVPEPSGNVLVADDPVAHLDKPTPVRPYGRPNSPVLNGAPHGGDREVERVPIAKLRKLQPKSKEQQAGENDPRASQTAHEVTMELDRVSSMLPNVPDARSKEHQLQTPQQQAANGAFTSSLYDPAHDGATLNHSFPVLWLGHPPALTPITVPEAYVHSHAGSWAPPPLPGSTTAGMDLYATEPFTSMGMSPMSFAPAASGSLLCASKGENHAALHPYVSYLSAIAAGSPAHSQLSSSHGLSPHPPSANEPTPESIPQPIPQPTSRARVPQHPQQQPWYYENDNMAI